LILRAHASFDYIDSAAVDPGQALHELGGARVIVATAASGASMTPLVDGLGLRGKLIVVGAAADPIEVTTGSLIFGGRSIEGSLTRTPSENEENLAFALSNDVHPMVERVPRDRQPRPTPGCGPARPASAWC
jgi:propanol-preferring alcohol dehydrogenase